MFNTTQVWLQLVCWCFTAHFGDNRSLVVFVLVALSILVLQFHACTSIVNTHWLGLWWLPAIARAFPFLLIRKFATCGRLVTRKLPVTGNRVQIRDVGLKWIGNWVNGGQQLGAQNNITVYINDSITNWCYRLSSSQTSPFSFIVIARNVVPRVW